jgi:hypothetical protein
VGEEGIGVRRGVQRRPVRRMPRTPGAVRVRSGHTRPCALADRPGRHSAAPRVHCGDAGRPRGPPASLVSMRLGSGTSSERRVMRVRTVRPPGMERRSTLGSCGRGWGGQGGVPGRSRPEGELLV